MAGTISPVNTGANTVAIALTKVTIFVTKPRMKPIKLVIAVPSANCACIFLSIGQRVLLRDIETSTITGCKALPRAFLVSSTLLAKSL